MARLKKSQLLYLGGVVVGVWVILNFYTFFTGYGHKVEEEQLLVWERLQRLQARISQQQSDSQQLLERLQHFKPAADQPSEEHEAGGREAKRDEGKSPSTVVLPVLVIACDRTTVTMCLDSLLRYRPSAAMFPIIVSQDCNHKATADVIQSYITKNTSHFMHIKQPDQSNIKMPPTQKNKKLVGYYKIARHFKWAIDQVFHTYNHSAVIIVEDDLEVAPDFYDYFLATYRILQSDPSVWCVSAWNDNGKGNLVSSETEKLYRTDFFPGLGWMMEKHLWLELGPKWPDSFWDDWMRFPEQRKDRQCIRPEVCRTKTFGKKGVSAGMFYEKFLKFIQLNNNAVPFTKMNLSYLQQDNYHAHYMKEVSKATVSSAADVLAGKLPAQQTVQIQYKTKDEFKKTAKMFGIMEDFKAGIPRTAYRGIVTFIHKDRRVYLVPPTDWNGYDVKWT